MALFDLNDVITACQNRFNLIPNDLNIDIQPDFWNEFKTVYEQITNDEIISYDIHSVTIKNSTGNERSDISSKWLYYAYAFSPLYCVIDRYRRVWNDILEKVGITALAKTDRDKILKILPSSDWETQVDIIRPGTSASINTQINLRFHNSQISQIYFKKFLADPDWWCEGKTFIRTESDWIGSSIRKAAQVIHANSDRLPQFVETVTKSKKLKQMLSNLLKNKTAKTKCVDLKLLVCLPKPFLLLAGISGTGKTRFVREQSRTSADLYGITQGDNYCLVPVRPDWHEPSDLLGYISRIGNDGARYIVTDLLRFIVAAWKHTVKSASASGIDYKEFDSVCSFWLCLDEMNLAPVEQYFADYLSIIETRKWEDGSYSCDSFLKPAVINQQLDENGRTDLWEKLEIAGDDPLHTGLREYFSAKGIPLPPNLIVAGTVNMDETTHGFSRKVIDRALTMDFGEFFPNDYDEYYEADRKHTVKPLSFPRLSGVHQESDLASVSADPDGRRTIVFLKSINEILDDTPFKLAYRALNEALMSVVCFQPSDDLQLQAVWDDFLMMKVLPRIEGDAEKLGYEGEETGLLFRLIQLLKQLLPATRPDLLRMAADGASSPA